MEKIFRVVAFLEGVSYLVLMYFAYINRDEEMIRVFGMPHGLLFIGYVVLAFLLKSSYKWDNKTFFIVLIASLIPFGTFYIDKKYLKNA
ncbi:MAG: integral membrane protein [Urechidicola sp.]|jgi:integral membrane protein|tara:strand:+ start:2521 stop:2787 length:267 start_codon:yes stop_codon:yes gene_type:complete